MQTDSRMMIGYKKGAATHSSVPQQEKKFFNNESIFFYGDKEKM